MSVAVERIAVITDLLLGAAYADARLEAREEATVRKLLQELLDGADLPESVDARIKGFTRASFDLAATAKDFASDPPIQKRKLLELVAAVRDADEEIDMDEDQYLQDLGAALGMDPSEFSDLTLEVQVEELKENLKALGALPPRPPPRKS